MHEIAMFVYFLEENDKSKWQLWRLQNLCVLKLMICIGPLMRRTWGTGPVGGWALPQWQIKPWREGGVGYRAEGEVQALQVKNSFPGDSNLKTVERQRFRNEVFNWERSWFRYLETLWSLQHEGTLHTLFLYIYISQIMEWKIRLKTVKVFL